MGIEAYLRDQAIRLRREKWPNPTILSDELWLMFSNIRVPPAELATTDENGNLIVVPPIDIPGLDIPTLDLGDPDDPVNDQPTIDITTPDGDDPSDLGNHTTTSVFWHRESFPGEILANNGNGNFTISLLRDGTTQPLDTVAAVITDDTLAEDVEEGTWVAVWMFALYTAVSEVVAGVTQPTRIVASFVEYLFNFPGQPSGGRWGVVTTPISALSGTTPGSGAVMLKKKAEDGATWVDDVSAEVFSTVASTVQAGKTVQLKRISGELFVDVEDCADDEEPT